MLAKLGELYLKHIPTAQVKELYSSIAIRQFAVSMIAIFEPIYLYRLYGSLQSVLLFYTALYIIYFFMIPVGGKLAARYGFEHCISMSVVFTVAYYLTLSGLGSHPQLIYLALILTVSDKTLQRVSYHANLARYGKDNYRGREVGIMSFLESVAGLIGPLMGGIILTAFGFGFLFAVVSVIAVISMLPMLSTRETFKKQDFSCRQAFSDFFRPTGAYKRRDSIAYMGYGEEFIVASLWPIFTYLFLADYHIIGLVSTAASVLVMLTKLYLGKLSDRLQKGAKRKWTELIAVLYGLLNLSRAFISTSFGVFLANFCSDTLKAGIVYPYFTYVYSAAGENDHFLRYAVFYEMSLVFGKVIIGLGLLVLSFYFVGSGFWFIIFLVAALWSLLYSLLKF